jgi:hypothetical protein
MYCGVTSVERSEYSPLKTTCEKILDQRILTILYQLGCRYQRIVDHMVLSQYLRRMDRDIEEN